MSAGIFVVMYVIPFYPGLKPTHGLVPYTGAADANALLDHVGPMAKTVQDCALMLEVFIEFHSAVYLIVCIYACRLLFLNGSVDIWWQVLAGYDDGLDPRQDRSVTTKDYTSLVSY